MKISSRYRRGRRARRQLGPRTLALVDHGSGPVPMWVRLYIAEQQTIATP